MNFKKLLKKITPGFLLSWYHWGLAALGATLYGFPSRKLTVIGVTGTSGKTTTVDFITRILEESGKKVASISSLRFKVGEKEWKNEMKMSMGGRFKNQKFLRQAKKAGCTYVVLEVTSEGIRQFRHKFINFDTAVFTNLSPEHLESHGGMENYRNEKLKLFKVTKNVHVINVDSDQAEHFLKVPAKQVYGFFIKDIHPLMHEISRSTFWFAENIVSGNGQLSFDIQDVHFVIPMLGQFNIYNTLAAVSVAFHYGVSLEVCAKALQKATGVPGRMEVVSKNPLVVVDYAHTPEQLEQAYKSLAPKKLVCVLGACGGGRDKWKRPVLGRIAAENCREIIVTDEDPYDEDPLEIMQQVAEGVGEKPHHIVLDRKEAIKKALELAKPEDAVVITGKGAEPLMCLANGVKIPWDDREIVRKEITLTSKK